MKRMNLAALPWIEWSSPGGAFRGRSKEVSIALGAAPRAHLGQGGHPFDLEAGRLAPGEVGCPFHRHLAQWEMFLITAGHGIVRHGHAQRDVVAGDVVLHPPGAAHQLRNAGDADLDYLLIANNPPLDVVHYPDSNKWGFHPGGGFYRPAYVDYWHGEEEGARGEVSPPASLPFAESHFARMEDLPWERRVSPTGKYDSSCRDVSLALGGIPDTGTWAGGHPFDVQLRRVPAGAAICPLHAHAVQWELFVVISGTATVRTEAGRETVGPGDVFLQTPGTAHQIINTGSDQFSVWVIADHSPSENIWYRDSKKWLIKPQRKAFRMMDAEYYDGEE